MLDKAACACPISTKGDSYAYCNRHHDVIVVLIDIHLIYRLEGVHEFLITF